METKELIEIYDKLDDIHNKLAKCTYIDLSQYTELSIILIEVKEKLLQLEFQPKSKKSAEDVLEKHVSLKSPNGNFYTEDDILKAMQEYAQIQLPQWISVKDRLPESKKEVIITDGKYVQTGSYQPDAKQNWHIGQNVFVNTITHWMPLPNAPK